MKQVKEDEVIGSVIEREYIEERLRTKHRTKVSATVEIVFTQGLAYESRESISLVITPRSDKAAKDLSKYAYLSKFGYTPNSLSINQCFEKEEFTKRCGEFEHGGAMIFAFIPTDNFSFSYIINSSEIPIRFSHEELAQSGLARCWFGVRPKTHTPPRFPGDRNI